MPLEEKASIFRFRVWLLLGLSLVTACDTAFTRRALAPIPLAPPDSCLLTTFLAHDELDSAGLPSVEPLSHDSSSIWLGGVRYRNRDLLTAIGLRPSRSRPDTLEVSVFAMGSAPRGVDEWLRTRVHDIQTSGITNAYCRRATRRAEHSHGWRAR
jgi:hypothetical protein